MLDFTGKTVFIAEVSPGMKAYSENLIKELERHGCAVKTVSKEVSQISDILEECDFAFHLLSDQDQNAESLEEKQLLLSISYYQRRNLATGSNIGIYAWIPIRQINSQYEQSHLPNYTN